MMDSLGVEVGSSWSHKKDGSILIVVQKTRTGHQYDRVYSCSCMLESGVLKEIEDYMLIREYAEVQNSD